jgi:hypothetical protein
MQVATAITSKCEFQCLAYRVVATIYIVTHEQVVGVRRFAANAKQLHEVMKLAMHITADCYRASYRLHIGLFQQHFSRLQLNDCQYYM